MIILKPKPRLYVHAGKIEEISRLEAQANVFEVTFEKQLNLLNLKSGMQVLDAGCGTGAKTRKIALRVKPGQVFGVDIDPLFIKHAKQFAQNKSIKNIRFEVGNIDDLRFKDALFDLTYCSLVLMHVQNPVNTLIELKRVTKLGGYVTVSDVDNYGISMVNSLRIEVKIDTLDANSFP
jgi:ubiquinone/menaquinone biosynthesis C-methylase UbiE